jgi:hypothetical protein
VTPDSGDIQFDDGIAEVRVAICLIEHPLQAITLVGHRS